MASHPGKVAAIMAFNTRIAEELRKKLGQTFGLPTNLSKTDLERALAAKGVVVKTLHAGGFVP